MSEPKKQHYVPQTYLRKFSFSNNHAQKIFVLHKDKRRIFCTNIMDTAAERHFYTVKMNDDQYLWENIYSRGIEPLLGNTLTQIITQYGIDSSAHRGAVENCGKTIAVLGCGVDICYPDSNRLLRENIIKDGLLLSEYEPGTPPLPYRFPMRNRIISGLCLGTIIVEAGLSSGSLITAECAADQGRNIYAIPGNINSVYSFGTNKLIQDGATPLIVFDDIIDELGIKRMPSAEAQKIRLGKDEGEIYEQVLLSGETTADAICRSTGRLPSDVNAMVTILEMKGLLQTALGKIFIAK